MKESLDIRVFKQVSLKTAGVGLKVRHCEEKCWGDIVVFLLKNVHAFAREQFATSIEDSFHPHMSRHLLRQTLRSWMKRSWFKVGVRDISELVRQDPKLPKP